jgi:hypothetical protein
MTDADGSLPPQSAKLKHLVLLDEWDVALHGPASLAEEQVHQMVEAANAGLLASLRELERRLRSAYDTALSFDLHHR